MQASRHALRNTLRGLRARWRRRRRPAVSRPDDVAPTSEALSPPGIDLDPDCPTCGGTRSVTVLDPKGQPMRVPCSECAPNDARGG